MSENVLPPVSGKDLYRKKFNMHIMITKRCNQKCVYCYYPNKPAPDMSVDMVKDIISQCQKLDKDIFYDLSGGEPLLHKDVFEIIEFFLPEGKEILLNTNGTLIDDHAAQKFAEYQKDYNFFPVISLDSHIKEVNCKTRPMYDEVIAGFKKMKKHGAKFAVDITLSAINNPEILGTVEFLAKNYTHDVVLCKLRPVFDVKDEAMFLTNEQIVETYKKVHELKDKYGFNFYRSFDSDGKDFCTAGIDKVAIGYNGDVFPCYMLENMVVGNIKDTPLKNLLEKSNEAVKGKGRDFIICESKEYQDILNSKKPKF